MSPSHSIAPAKRNTHSPLLGQSVPPCASSAKPAEGGTYADIPASSRGRNRSRGSRRVGLFWPGKLVVRRILLVAARTHGGRLPTHRGVARHQAADDRTQAVELSQRRLSSDGAGRRPAERDGGQTTGVERAGQSRGTGQDRGRCHRASPDLSRIDSVALPVEKPPTRIPRPVVWSLPQTDRYPRPKWPKPCANDTQKRPFPSISASK